METSKISMSGNQDLHGKMNLNRGLPFLDLKVLGLIDLDLKVLGVTVLDPKLLGLAVLDLKVLGLTVGRIVSV